MNLIPCQDCNRQISPNAQACPHCGSPVKPEYLQHLRDLTQQEKEQKQRINKIFVVVFGIGLGMLFLMFVAIDLASKPTHVTPQKTEGSRKKAAKKLEGGKSILATAVDEAQKKPRTQKDREKDFKDAQKVVKEAIRIGLIYKTQCGAGHIFVYPHKWNALEYDGKQTFAMVMQIYCGYFHEMDKSYIEIKNSKNGKILAKSTVMSGIKLY